MSAQDADYWRDKYNREVLGLNNEGDPIGGDPPTGLKQRLDRASQEIARLTERCDAYKGQVKVGDEQILALRSRAKEMQREKAELTERCDAYKEALAVVRACCGQNNCNCPCAPKVKAALASAPRQE